MTDKTCSGRYHRSTRPEQLPRGEVVATARCAADVCICSQRHVIVVRHAGKRQTFQSAKWLTTTSAGSLRALGLTQIQVARHACQPISTRSPVVLLVAFRM